MNNIGKAVWILRRVKGWTLDQLADESDVGKRTIQDVESGVCNPRKATVQKLSVALGANLNAENLTEIVKQAAGQALGESQAPPEDCSPVTTAA